jgi:hypothetical protein
MVELIIAFVAGGVIWAIFGNAVVSAAKKLLSK